MNNEPRIEKVDIDKIPAPEDRDYLFSPEIEEHLARRRSPAWIPDEPDHNKRFMKMHDPKFIKEHVTKLRKAGWIEFTLEDVRAKFEHRPFDLEYYENVINQGYKILYHPTNLAEPGLMYKLLEEE